LGTPIKERIMGLPYARKQLERYITGKVIENVTKQIVEQQTSQQSPSSTAQEPGAAPTSPDIARLVDSINAAFAQTYEQIEALEARVGQVDQRMSTMERRWGLRTMAYVVFAVALAFVLGLVAFQLLHLVGVNI
jgi:hypothetical protein